MLELYRRLWPLEDYLASWSAILWFRRKSYPLELGVGSCISVLGVRRNSSLVESFPGRGTFLLYFGIVSLVLEGISIRWKAFLGVRALPGFL